MNLYDYYTKPQELTGYDERIAKIPQLAYKYARSTGQQFPEGEAVIATDPKWAYWYANLFDLVYDKTNKRFN